MAQVTKRMLSGSTNGRGILVVATATPGTLIHTSTASTNAGTWDEIWLYAFNSNNADVAITIELGGVTVPNDNIKVAIPFQQGRFLVLDGAILQNGAVVRAWGSSGSLIVVTGFVNQITA